MWLLEELQLPYELKIYKRNEQLRAPKELEEVHPLGKSPVVEVVRPGRSSLILAESGHITQYLADNYDPHGILSVKDPDVQEQVGYFLHFAEGNIMQLLVGILIGSFAQERASFGFKYLVWYIMDKVNKAYYSTELVKVLDYLEKYVKEKGEKYLLGNKLTAADIIMSYPLLEFVFSNPERTKSLIGSTNYGNNIDVVERYPTLFRWSNDISKEPKLIKANEIVEARMARL